VLQHHLLLFRGKLREPLVKVSDRIMPWRHWLLPSDLLATPWTSAWGRCWASAQAAEPREPLRLLGLDMSQHLALLLRLQLLEPPIKFV